MSGVASLLGLLIIVFLPSLVFVQALFPLRITKTSPATVATAPPTTIQMALSVGEPLKNFDTSEVKDVEALMPKASRIMPPTNSAIAIGLFIEAIS
jgi:hypothetical protein